MGNKKVVSFQRLAKLFLQEKGYVVEYTLKKYWLKYLTYCSRIILDFQQDEVIVGLVAVSPNYTSVVILLTLSHLITNPFFPLHSRCWKITSAEFGLSE